MLDAHTNHAGLMTAAPPAAARPTALPGAIRSLFARLAWRTPPYDEAPAPLDVRVRRTLARQARLRAEAHAAFRSVEGPAPAALDAALAVLESEIARLSDAAEAYGEALKSVRTYDDDPAQRAMAAAALYAFPVPLRAPAAVPHAVPHARQQPRHG